MKSLFKTFKHDKHDIHIEMDMCQTYTSLGVDKYHFLANTVMHRIHISMNAEDRDIRTLYIHNN